MTPIDLCIFADYAQKIPSSLLALKTVKPKSSTGRVLLSHSIDVGLVMGMTVLAGSFASLSVGSFMVTRGLEKAYTEVGTMKLIFSFFPLILYSYFFFWNYMNEGQTPGMLILKRRLKLEKRCLNKSLQSAAWSFLLCMSAGLILIALKRIKSLFYDHDHLYQELISYKEHSVINLLDQTLTFETSVEEELWQKAA